MHDGNTMGHSNAFGGVGAVQHLGNTDTATAVPDPTGISFVMPRHLREVRTEIGPRATDNDGQTGIDTSDERTSIPSNTARS